MARADSLSGTPDPLALPELLNQLTERVTALEQGIGGGFLLAPDAEADDILNVETNDGSKLQIFPPLVTPQMIAEIWKEITPEVVQFPLNRGTAEITRVGRRVWLVGQAQPINAPDWHNGTNVIGTVPEEFAPTEWQSFPCSCEARYDHQPRTTRCDINDAGQIRFYSIPASRVDPKRVVVTIEQPGQRTDQGGEHQHGSTGSAGGHTHSGNTGAASTGTAHTHPTGGNNPGGHTHTTSPSSTHSHWMPGQTFYTPHTYDQGATLVPDTAKYPNWVNIVATWTLAGKDQTEGSAT
ncbi:hypothetical protein [Streptomyces sp. cg35]|uniref:hypothetical protein n=1 Tax=Streptomyces sp. cg35 TaxID=3421650 RepID=UPI003D178092